VPLQTNYSFGATAVNSHLRPVFLSTGNGLIAYSAFVEPLWTNYSFEGNITVNMRRDGELYLTHSNALIAYTPTGVPRWTNYGIGGNVAVDEQNGNVYVTGNSAGGNDFIDCGTAAYNSGGDLLWTKQFDGSSNPRSVPTGITADSLNGNVYVSGASTDSNGFSRYVTVAYSAKGMPLWTNNYTDKSITSYQSSSQSVAADDVPVGNSAATPLATNVYYSSVSDVIEVGKNGDFYVAGSTYEAYSNYTVSVQAPMQLSFRRLSNKLVLSWTNAAFQLQSAPSFLDKFTNVPGATSPWTNSFKGDKQFFRLMGH